MGMKTIKGPAIFLAQFVGDKAPFNNLEKYNPQRMGRSKYCINEECKKFL